MCIPKEDKDTKRVLCDPSTGQYAILPPDMRTTNNSNYHDFLGFDPIDKQFKVLVFNHTVDDKLVYHIVTLGTENLRWREIICPLTYGYCWEHICINGVLYYLAFDPNKEHDMIGCFDVRSEKVKSLNLNPDCFRNWSTKLINYKGKLGVINLEDDCDGRFPLKLREIVLAKGNVYNPFYVYYFNPEKNTLLSVEIQGVREGEDWSNIHRVYYFVDHVEGLQFDVMKTTYAATSISPLEQSTSTSSREDHQVRTLAHQKEDRLTFESVNKFDALSLLEDD
ncbi:hypothetical protein ARALYDRAFT_336233 [Arabidopsis lyrata subsp. lyrata]|uniref:F-box associated beta-propeller type 3 domain-containing protein n=1 Tax=Arabidopsis lyrata subsp. lyrata TaxID=81972 RepID=D7KGJ2_ARALL|nr:hypothetical protein ARALYDRAFT_336233 [Arabidopsis lyrata subsp. lyrata]